MEHLRDRSDTATSTWLRSMRPPLLYPTSPPAAYWAVRTVPVARQPKTLPPSSTPARLRSTGSRRWMPPG